MKFPNRDQKITKEIRVALLYDLDDWILGKIARELVDSLGNTHGLSLVALRSPTSASECDALQRSTDVLHFLSLWEYLKVSSFLYRPNVVTIHHIGSTAYSLLSNGTIQADAYCATNKQCHDTLKSMPWFQDKPIFRTPYALNTEFFRPTPEGKTALRSALNLPETDQSILIGLSAKPTSNEDQRKGFDRYWEFLRTIKTSDSLPPVKLILFGPDASNPNGWKDELIPQDIRDLVKVMGFVSNEQLPLFYSGLDYYLCLSRIEGGPYPVMECMACGVPVISTLVGVTGDLIEDQKTGFIVDEANYLERIPAILSSNEERSSLTKLARERVIELHSNENAINGSLYSQLYQSVIDHQTVQTKLSRLIKKLYCKIRSLLKPTYPTP